MYCPKCGAENSDSAEKCSSCSCILTTVLKEEEIQHRRRSVPAVASFVLAIFSVAFILGGWGWGWSTIGFLLSVVLSILAIIFGITSLVKITKSARPLKGKGFAIAGIVIPIVHCAIVITFITIEIRRYSTYVRQTAQLRSIDIALLVFKSDWGDYPPSSALDDLKQPYCGAQKLAEALLGQDLMGFHPNSKFKHDGTDASGKPLYGHDTLDVRRGPYLEPRTANVYALRDVFKDVEPFDGESFVICDMYNKKRHSGIKTGMPILYYRANTSSKTMDASESMDKRIYNADDNLNLISLGRTKNGKIPPLAADNGEFFYHKDYKIIDPNVTVTTWPYRPDSFILISAGKDSVYGTQDDIVNVKKL